MCRCHDHLSRFPLIQPYLLLFLFEKPAHGYELTEKLATTGLGQCVDATTVYRNLRRMEEEGLVASRWDTEGPGPARRLYHLTPLGEELLHSWAAILRQKKELLESFLQRYRQHFSQERSPSERR